MGFAAVSLIVVAAIVPFGLGTAGGHSAAVVRNGASTLHNLLQLAASSMEPDLDRGEGQAQKLRDLRSGKGVGFVQQNYGAVLVGQEIQTALNACACFLSLRDLEGRGRLRNEWRNAILAFLVVEGNKRLALAQTVEAHVCGDAVQPAANGFWIAQRVPMTIGTEKRILREICGFGGAFHETEDVAIDSIVVSLEQQTCVNGSTSRSHTLSSTQ
jgi:hypothetical protein